jgi:hypothetical protein
MIQENIEITLLVQRRRQYTIVKATIDLKFNDASKFGWFNLIFDILKTNVVPYTYGL